MCMLLSVVTFEGIIDKVLEGRDCFVEKYV